MATPTTRARTSGSHGSSAVNPLAAHPHLTGRDRVLLGLLEDHRVLTADQITRLLFTRVRTCQLRLEVLRGLDLLDRFRFARPYGGSEPWKWVLGYAGARFQAAAAARPAPTVRAHREHTLRLSASATLDHLLTTNEFFTRLHHAARTTPEPGTSTSDENASTDGGTDLGASLGPNTSGTAAGGRRVQRWWPEHLTAARFPGIQPDGHGLWTDPTSTDPTTTGPTTTGPTTTARTGTGRTSTAGTVGFFLETDLGTENLPRLLAKLDGYARLAARGGPTYPVLFWLPGTDRETNLQRLLRDDPPPVPVATATHDVDPADAVWLPVGDWQRHRLRDLPCDHGPHTAGNPNWRDGHLDLTDQRPTRH